MADSKQKPRSWSAFVGGNPRKWMVPLLRFEWVCEHVAYYLSRWAFIEVLEYVGKLSLLGAMIAFLWAIPERRRAAEDQRKAKNYQAWQTINSALGQTGNGGRIDALQDLNRDRISLAGVDVSGAFLMDLDLRRAYMQFARMTNVTFVRPNFSNAYLWSVRFKDSYFEDAIFVGANLDSANFAEARFRRGDFSDDFSNGFSGSFSNANLAHAYFWAASAAGLNFSKANLTGALLMDANLHSSSFAGAVLSGADFSSANLSKADLRGTDLDSTDFQSAFLYGADFTGVARWRTANFRQANVFGLRNPPDGFMDWATNKMAAVAIPMDSYSDWQKWLGKHRSHSITR